MRPSKTPKMMLEPADVIALHKYLKESSREDIPDRQVLLDNLHEFIMGMARSAYATTTDHGETKQ